MKGKLVTTLSLAAVAATLLVGAPVLGAGDGHDHAGKGAGPATAAQGGSMGGGMMMHDMGGMMGEMKSMMEHMSGMMGGEGMMDRKQMEEMSKVMSEMSKTMQEMSRHMAKGEMDAATQKRMQEQLKSTRQRLNRLGKTR